MQGVCRSQRYGSPRTMMKSWHSGRNGHSCSSPSWLCWTRSSSPIWTWWSRISPRSRWWLTTLQIWCQERKGFTTTWFPTWRLGPWGLWGQSTVEMDSKLGNTYAESFSLTRGKEHYAWSKPLRSSQLLRKEKFSRDCCLLRSWLRTTREWLQRSWALTWR